MSLVGAIPQAEDRPAGLHSAIVNHPRRSKVAGGKKGENCNPDASATEPHYVERGNLSGYAKRKPYKDSARKEKAATNRIGADHPV